MAQCPVSVSDVSKQPSAYIFTVKPSNNIPLHLLPENQSTTNEGTTILRNAESRSQNLSASHSKKSSFRNVFIRPGVQNECGATAPVIAHIQPPTGYTKPHMGPTQPPMRPTQPHKGSTQPPMGSTRSLFGPPGQLCSGFRERFEQG